MNVMKTEKRKYRGIEDLYEAEDQLRSNREKRRDNVISLPESNSLSKSNSQLDSDSQLESNSPPEFNSLLESNSLPENQEVDYHDNRQPKSDRLLYSNTPHDYHKTEDVSLNVMASLPEIGGFTKFWHQLTDHLYRQLTPAEQVVHLQLYRLSWGHGKATCQIGLPRLAERAGIGRSTAQQAVNRLVKKGLVKKLKMIIGSNKEQGIEYYVEPPSSLLKSNRLPESSSPSETGRLPKSTPIKEKNTYKESTHKDPSQIEKEKEEKAPERAMRGVRVGSKFSIEDCRLYAEYLNKTGQGINNPGGFAMTIYRSGEADELITTFLQPKTKPAKNDHNGCPRCYGTGLEVVEGKGARRCTYSWQAEQETTTRETTTRSVE